MRSNEWSDHYVQSAGVAAVSVFFMQRRFHDLSDSPGMNTSPAEMLCLAILINGVITGHPGFWPIAMLIWVPLIGIFLTSPAFRTRISSWIMMNRVGISIVLVASAISFLVVTYDLLSELNGEDFGEGRLQRTQGLFSEFAFGGLYGLSEGGSLPP
jgi:hypothetical protein